MKLTAPQMELLRGSNDRVGVSCVPQYKPAQRLVKLGLAQWRSDERLQITNKGRSVLTGNAKAPK